MNSRVLLKPILTSLLAFILAAGLGLALRWAFVIDMPVWFDYKNIQHAHSHVALLGWLFAIFCLCAIHFFDLDFGRYARLYWALQGCVVGMLLTFPIMGYASLSIIFSTAHIVLSYFLAYRIWKDVGGRKKDDGVSVLFLKSSLFFMVLSTLGTWALGPIMAAGLKGSALYYASIQFYLHFQFNGWFIFAMIALVLAIFEKRGIAMDPSKIKLFYRLLLLATLLTYALAITWSTPYFSIFVINSIGVLLQLLSLVVFMKLLYDQRQNIRGVFSDYTYRMFGIAFLALVFKVVIQTVVVIPALAEVSYTIRNFVIGFIHLLMLACLSLFALGCIGRVFQRSLHIYGTWTFISGIVLSELLLFVQGIMVWQGWGIMSNYYLMLASASALILLGIVLIFVDLYGKRRSITESSISN